MLSIVIPAYNEEKRIEKTLKRIIEYADTNIKDYEIIVVNDGSKDKTVSIVKKFKKVKLLNNPGNKGKGYSVRHGVLKSKGNFILFTDSDLATPIEEYERLKPFLNKGYSIAFGSRSKRQDQPLLRKIIGKTFSLIVNVIALPDVKDSQCGFKLFNKKSARAIFSRLTLERFSFDVEILFIARKLGFKAKEVPVIWVNKQGSKVNVFKDSIIMLKDILKIRMNDIKGKYSKSE